MSSTYVAATQTVMLLGESDAPSAFLARRSVSRIRVARIHGCLVTAEVPCDSRKLPWRVIYDA